MEIISSVMFFLTCVWISPGKKSPKLSNVKLTLALAESNENCQTLVTIKEFVKISQEIGQENIDKPESKLKVPFEFLNPKRENQNMGAAQV